MNTDNNEPSENPDAFHISVWENEGGSPSREDRKNRYGRQIEPTGSRIIDHLFSPIFRYSSCRGRRIEIELGEADATAIMFSFNAPDTEKRKSARLHQAFAVQFRSARDA